MKKKRKKKENKSDAPRFSALCGSVDLSTLDEAAAKEVLAQEVAASDEPDEGERGGRHQKESKVSGSSLFGL